MQLLRAYSQTTTKHFSHVYDYKFAQALPHCGGLVFILQFVFLTQTELIVV